MIQSPEVNTHLWLKFLVPNLSHSPQAVWYSEVQTQYQDVDSRFQVMVSYEELSLPSVAVSGLKVVLIVVDQLPLSLLVVRRLVEQVLAFAVKPP